jgi:hypothetical protein
MKFPEVSGNNLNFKTYYLPKDLNGELNILILAFKRSQQSLVDEWISFLDELVVNFPAVRYYEIPTIGKSYNFIKSIIDGGMRAGIPNDNARERTITIYIDKRSFKEALQIKDENTIYLFLVKKGGDIIWCTDGRFHKKKAEELEEKLFHFKAEQA